MSDLRATSRALPTTSSAHLARALVDLLVEPFATCEDVGLDVRRVDAFVDVPEAPPGDGVVVELADGAAFCITIERTR